jgi:iron complex transport system permease protein
MTSAAPARSVSAPDFRRLFRLDRRRAAICLLLAAALLALSLLLAVCLSAEGVPVSPGSAIRVIGSHLLMHEVPTDASAQMADGIVWYLRLPRAVVAALVGALLAYAGVALQGLLMNPLADPYTVGVSSGAALGAAAAELLGLTTAWFGFARMGVAFGCAVGAVLLVYALARVGGRVSTNTFLLAGVVVGTLLASFVPLLLALAHRANDMSRLLFYLIGSLTGADWSRAALLVPFLVITVICLSLWARELNLMTLGEESAAHLGVDIERARRRVLVVGSLCTAAAVAVAGIIGFVGLVVPHVARRLTGPDHRALLPLAGLLGASLLVLSDTVARVWLNEVQVGVVTSLVGAPIFCYLLRRRQSAVW